MQTRERSAIQSKPKSKTALLSTGTPRHELHRRATVTTPPQVQSKFVTMENPLARRKRKEEARQLKRKRVEDAGGVRPRAKDSSSRNENGAANKTSLAKKREPEHSNRTDHRPKSSFSEKHRFGRVMECVPCRNEPRHWTLSIAVPGSVVSNCQTRELRTQLVGQIARAAAVYQVDEIVVFDDKLADRGDRGYYHRGHRNRQRDHHAPTDRNKDSEITPREGDQRDNHEQVRSDPHTFMARVLQYCECPQYLRRSFFPMHPDLQFTGLLAPIDAPHHVRVEERSKYREGVVLEKKGTGPDAGSLVNCGIRGRPVE